MVVDTKYLMKIATYAKKQGISRQGVWHRIKSGMLKEERDYTTIDGEVFLLTNSRVTHPRFQKEFKKESEEGELFINTFNNYQ